jgi:hypothetical protein
MCRTIVKLAHVLAFLLIYPELQTFRHITLHTSHTEEFRLSNLMMAIQKH